MGTPQEPAISVILTSNPLFNNVFIFKNSVIAIHGPTLLVGVCDDINIDRSCAINRPLVQILQGKKWPRECPVPWCRSIQRFRFRDAEGEDLGLLDEY